MLFVGKINFNLFKLKILYFYRNLSSYKMKTITSILFFFLLITIPAQNEVTIKTTALTNNIYMLEGQGGNIGVSTGDDGVIMIDSQFARLTPLILDAIKALSDKPIKILLNTHWHGDHTGGNENIEKLGTTIIAHNNVFKRLNDAFKEEKNKTGLPLISFNDELSLHINDELVLVFHVKNAHTDSDSMLYFTTSNVLHTGDTFFTERYPYIDLNSGGSIDGYINAVKRALILIDEDTKIIPGHGKLSTKADYQFFLNMLETIKLNVLTEIANGKTEDEVATNTNLTKTYDDLNYSWRLVDAEKIRRTFYKSLKQ
jgi:cyclase